jgi:hypothetical protein
MPSPSTSTPLACAYATINVRGRVVILDARDAASLAGSDLISIRGCPHVRYFDAGRRRITTLARVIARPGPGLCAHVPAASPGGPLDLRRERIAVMTRAECQRLARKPRGCSSAYRGVVYVVSKGRFRALVWHHRKLIHAGYFRSEMDAALARDALALSLFGHAPLALNFPPAPPPATTLAITQARPGRRRHFRSR